MRVKCGYCGGEFDVPETARYVVCPYCGALLSRRKGGEFIAEAGHFYYPVNQRDPFKDLVSFIYGSADVPGDFKDSVSLAEHKLYYIPLYSYYVDGEVSLYKLGDIVTTYRHGEYVTVPAVDIGLISQLLAPWHTALEGKRAYDPSIREMGEYYEPEIHPFDQAWMAELVYKWWVKIRVWRSLGRMFDSDAQIASTRFTNIVDYPVWMIKYRYGDETYTAYVDGVDNSVIIAEYPRTRSRELGVLAYMVGLAAVIGAASYYIVSRIELLSNLRYVASLTTLAVSAIPIIQFVKWMKQKPLVSSVWSRDEIEYVFEVFIKFPF